VLNVAGMAEHLTLEMELNESGVFHHTGNAEWAVGTAERDALLTKIRRLQSWGYAAEIVDRTTLHDVDPNLIPPDDATALAFYPSEGYVDAPALAATLLERARGLGAQVRKGDAVVSLGSVNGRSRTITLSNGEKHSAEMVVSAAGRWTGRLLATAGFELPMAPTRSCLAVTSPVPVRLRTMLYSSAINIRAEGNDRLLLQNTATDLQGDEASATITPENFEQELLARARRAVRNLDGLRIDDPKIGIRAIPGDGLPVVGPVPGCERLYVVCSHSGVTLAPFYARAVTKEIVSGTPEERLATFRPDRFCTAPTSS
ncbi:MAG: FAD-binding oxidoreductase, partial [Candidatus Eremiobacteraeota bacterium]|nr:FAD-binding oxidoreductase [Candidatus Eremiobacteraeota bacterium]